MQIENWDVLTLTEVLANRKRVNVCEHTVKMVQWNSSEPEEAG